MVNKALPKGSLTIVHCLSCPAAQFARCFLSAKSADRKGRYNIIPSADVPLLARGKQTQAEGQQDCIHNSPAQEQGYWANRAR